MMRGASLGDMRYDIKRWDDSLCEDGIIKTRGILSSHFTCHQSVNAIEL